MKKGSPGQAIRHVTVSFDDWDNPGTQDPNVLTPTVVGSSTPTSTLETVLEQSAPSSPQPVIMVTETSFPYTPEKTSPRVARSLETEFNDERKPIATQDEKIPLVKISSDENTVFSDPLGNIPVSNKLVEVPIEFENSNEGNTDFSPSKLDQSNAKIENESTTKLNMLDFDSNNEDRPNYSEDPTISDVSTIGNIRPAVGGWSGTLDNGNLLSNSVDSGLHESTDHLLDARDLGSRDTMDTDGSTGPNDTLRDSEGELRIGQVISVGDSKVGTVRYIGTTEFASGEWVGVELELPVGKCITSCKMGSTIIWNRNLGIIYVNLCERFLAGKNDGAVNGKRYFTCKPRYGTFVRADKVTLLNTRPKSSSSSRVIVTNRQVLSGNPGTSSSRDNSGVQTRNKPRGGSSSDDAKRKDMNRRSNILF